VELKGTSEGETYLGLDHLDQEVPLELRIWRITKDALNVIEEVERSLGGKNESCDNERERR